MTDAIKVDAAQSSGSGTDDGVSKSGNGAAIAEFRGFLISLSTDSQGRDLPLIPTESDGFSMQNLSNTQSEMFTLPQSQSGEDRWNQAGPEFQQGQTRVRTYDNS